jgi:hypothetical protein
MLYPAPIIAGMQAVVLIAIGTQAMLLPPHSYRSYQGPKVSAPGREEGERKRTEQTQAVTGLGGTSSIKP